MGIEKGEVLAKWEVLVDVHLPREVAVIGGMREMQSDSPIL